MTEQLGLSPGLYSVEASGTEGVMSASPALKHYHLVFVCVTDTTVWTGRLVSLPGRMNLGTWGKATLTYACTGHSDLLTQLPSGSGKSVARI